MTGKTYRLTEAAIRRATYSHWKLFRHPKTDIASYLNEGVDRRSKWVVLDMLNQGMKVGMPDWSVFGPEPGQIRFLEFKAEDGRLSDAQRSCHAKLRDLGFVVEVVWGRDEPIAVLERWGVVRAPAVRSQPALAEG